MTLLSLPRVGRKTALNFYNSENFNLKDTDNLYEIIRLYVSKGNKFPNIPKQLIDENLNKSKILIEEAVNKNEYIISFDENNYPQKMKYIDDPPLILYAKGNINVLEKENSVALIGKRKVSKYGAEASYKLGYDLSKENIIIVSGLALGCDTQAHLGCVNANGAGIAVLAHGLDQVHPSSNKSLVNELIDKDGLIITEYPAGTNPTKFSYVDRDRIQSGLSDAVIVLETDELSGTMQTVQFAEKQKRPLGVLDFPSEAYEQEIALGNKLLIKDKRGYGFNIEDNIFEFYKNITKEKSSYLFQKIEKPFQSDFNF
jgi:DNA processing protein